MTGVVNILVAFQNNCATFFFLLVFTKIISPYNRPISAIFVVNSYKHRCSFSRPWVAKLLTDEEPAQDYTQNSSSIFFYYYSSSISYALQYIGAKPGHLCFPRKNIDSKLKLRDLGYRASYAKSNKLQF